MFCRENLFTSFGVSFIFLILLSSSCNRSLSKESQEILPKFSDPSTYQAIRSNVARLQAMLSGVFVQKSYKQEQDKYITWFVNDRQDSIMLYSLSIGDPNRDGYWLYHYQIMTSLPDDPVYQAFERLVVVDRDTIQSTFYSIPDNFEITLEELLTEGKKTFDDIDFDKLILDGGEDAGQYIRQNILYFSSEIMKPIEDHPEYKSELITYKVYPAQIAYGTIYYGDLQGVDQIGTIDAKFIKISMLN